MIEKAIPEEVQTDFAAVLGHFDALDRAHGRFFEPFVHRTERPIVVCAAEQSRRFSHARDVEGALPCGQIAPLKYIRHIRAPQPIGVVLALGIETRMETLLSMLTGQDADILRQVMV